MNAPLQLVGAALIAVVATLVSRPVARVTGAMATVRADRWHQERQVPCLGGPALLLALVPWVGSDVLLVLGGFCAIGALDDHKSLNPAMKGTLLLLPSAAAAWVDGQIWIGPACWVSANALNMLDHVDGTAASTCAGSLLVADGALGPSGAGASLGFLTHNWPPARAFLGDSGSLMLGALLVLAWNRHGPLATLGGTAVPLLDATFVTIRRIRNRQMPWIGGVDHSGHELLRLGLGATWLPVVYGCVATITALLGIRWL